MAETDQSPERAPATSPEPDQGSHRGKRGKHRHRHRRHKRSAVSSRVVTLAGIGMFCIVLILIGVFFGANFYANPMDDESYRQALQQRRKAHLQRLSDCADAGHSPWTCNKFDDAHFELAKSLDEFGCDPYDEESYRCRYVLGGTKVLVTLPQIYDDNNELRVSTTRPSTIISHSDQNDFYYISISDKGYVEFRDHNQEIPLFVINPLTGRLSSLH